LAHKTVYAPDDQLGRNFEGKTYRATQPAFAEQAELTALICGECATGLAQFDAEIAWACFIFELPPSLSWLQNYKNPERDTQDNITISVLMFVVLAPSAEQENSPP
jgi:hypothetical protein